jgi:hypothetical protein
MLGDDGTSTYVTPSSIRGDQVVDSRGVEVLRSKFNDDHKRLTGILVFVDLEPKQKWPHFCRWIWIDDHGRTREIERFWPPSEKLDMLRCGGQTLGE